MFSNLKPNIDTLETFTNGASQECSLAQRKEKTETPSNLSLGESKRQRQELNL